MVITVKDKPSPFSPSYVRMAMQYTKPSGPVGTDFEHLAPGSCAWNPHNFTGIPPEPGIVYIDLQPESQRWFAPETRQLDTTATAAAFFADTISIRRYLSDPSRRWLFYVDDQTNVSHSFGAYKSGLTAPTYVTITGPVQFAGAAPAPAPQPPQTPPAQGSTTSSSVGRPRTPGTSTTSAVATLAKLAFKGLDRRPNGFTARFSARPNASVSVAYSTEGAVNTPQGYYFPGAAVQGSGGVSRGGFSAEVQRTSASSLRADYSGSSRLPLQRGVAYNFIITVEGGNGPREQYVGKFTSMQQDVTVRITDMNITKKSFSQDARSGVQVFRNTGGNFSFCGAEGCENATDVIGLFIWARPNFGSTTPLPTSWTAVSGQNSGVAKLTFDTRLIKPERPMRSFTVTSMPGDVEFEAIGTISVKWR